MQFLLIAGNSFADRAKVSPLPTNSEWSPRSLTLSWSSKRWLGVQTGL